MTPRLKVMTIVGTRPDLIKTSRLLAELDRRRTTSSSTPARPRPLLSDVFFEELGLSRPKHYLGVAAATAMEAIAEIVVRADRVLEENDPTPLVLYGDTNSSLAVLSAKRRRVPIFHLEAGTAASTRGSRRRRPSGRRPPCRT